MQLVTRFFLLPGLLFMFLLGWLLWSTVVQPTVLAAPTADGAVLYRVNAGGPQLAAADGSLPDWSADVDAAPSPYVTFPVGQGKTFTTTQPITLDPSVPASVPAKLFQNERFDNPSGGPFPLNTEMRWAFPVTATLTVQVRLYFAEIYWSAPNLRVFDVEIDGVVPAVFDNLDIFALAGGKNRGVMRSYTVVSDGIVNIDFRHTGIDSPAIKGIEIVEGGDLPPTVVQPLADLNVLQDAPPSVVNLAAVFADSKDGSNLALTVSGNTNPTLVTTSLTAGTFTLSYAAGQSGAATITVRATDSAGGFVEDSFVVQVNGKPTLAPVAAQSVNEGATLSVTVTAADPENEDLALSATGLPTGAAFVDHNDKTGALTWTPDFNAAGNYAVTVTVMDSQGQVTSQTIAITVNNTNRAPVLAPIANQTVNEGNPLNVTMTASDADGDAIVLTAGGAPNDASFTDNGNGTATLTWTPGATAAGVHTVTVTATDSGALTSQQTFTITVGDANSNLPPVLAVLTNQSINEGSALVVNVAATDANGDSIVLSATGLPGSATFTDNGNGTALLAWTPSFSEAGLYTVTVTATDPGQVTDSQTFTLTVLNVNRKPTAAATGSQQVTEGETVTLTVTASDPDGDAITFSVTGVPTGATFTDKQNGTATLVWATKVGDAGDYTITVTVKDALNATVTQVLPLKVNANPGGATQDQQLFLPLIQR